MLNLEKSSEMRTYASAFCPKGTPTGKPSPFYVQQGNGARIQDIDGFESWIHSSMLSGKRSFIISNLSSETSTLFLRVAPREQSTAVAQIKTGAQGLLLECSEKWCLVELSLYRGWMSKKNLWGVYENEQIE